MEKLSAVVLFFAASLSPSCQIASSVMTGESIKRSRVVNEEGTPLAATIHPGIPAPFAERFNRTDKNGYFLVQLGVDAISVLSVGYTSFEGPTSSVPKTIMMKRAPQANTAAQTTASPSSGL